MVKIIIRFETTSNVFMMMLNLIHIEFQKKFEMLTEELNLQYFFIKFFLRFVKEQVSTMKNDML